MAAKNVLVASAANEAPNAKPSAAFTLTITYPHAAVVEFVEDVVITLLAAPEDYLPYRLSPNTDADIAPELLAALPSQRELIKRVSVGDLRPLLEKAVRWCDEEALSPNFNYMMDDSVDDLARDILAKFISTKAAINAIVKKAEAREEKASKGREQDVIEFLRTKGYKITKK